MTVQFATKNKNKFKEAVNVAAPYGIRLKHLNLEKREIQADRLTEIASFAANEFISRRKVRSVLTEDSGFFVDSMDGFPGPYSSYVFKTIGFEGLLKLVRNVKNRKASFRAAVAYCESGREPFCFSGEVSGTVAAKARGRMGFGFDPIFIPASGDGRTFAEMCVEEKNGFSHRAVALRKFCKWYIAHRGRLR